MGSLKRPPFYNTTAFFFFFITTGFDSEKNINCQTFSKPCKLQRQMFAFFGNTLDVCFGLSPCLQFETHAFFFLYPKSKPAKILFKKVTQLSRLVTSTFGRSSMPRLIFKHLKIKKRRLDASLVHLNIG